MNHEFRNEVEIRVVALRRSGQHAIMNWMMANSTGPRCFINNVRAGADPMVFNVGIETFDMDPEEVREAHKDLMIHNYEDKRLGEVFERPLGFYEGFLGRSRRIIDLLIIRDPYNCFASRLQMMLDRGSGFPGVRSSVLRLEDIKPYIEIWKSYAREYLEHTSAMRHNKIVISYNRWCTDVAYRTELAQRIGMRSSDRAVAEVPSYGRGSSFDKQTLNGRADSMDLHNRWRSFLSNPLFLGIFQDREVVELAETIFGHIPGTELLWDKRYLGAAEMKFPVLTRLKIILRQLLKRKRLGPLMLWMATVARPLRGKGH